MMPLIHSSKSGTASTKRSQASATRSANPPALRKILARLLKLNHERYAEEVQPGLQEKKKGGAKKKITTEKTPTLFAE